MDRCAAEQRRAQTPGIRFQYTWKPLQPTRPPHESPMKGGRPSSFRPRPPGTRRLRI